MEDLSATNLAAKQVIDEKLNCLGTVYELEKKVLEIYENARTRIPDTLGSDPDIPDLKNANSTAPLA